MCGIVGAQWGPTGKPIFRHALELMADQLRHRGPDDAGYYWCETERGGVALGHRRLSIIDLDSGRQPIGNEDGSIQVVFNGEIYNFAELRQQLIRQGHVFRTTTDTEVIVHLYEEYQENAVSRLRGMFAFALWDGRKKKLLLARDRMGQKPLVYRCEHDRILFGSQVKSLLPFADGELRIDPVALRAYLRFLCVPNPMSIYQGFSKIPPGHYAVYQEGQLTLNRYWQPNLDPDVSRPKTEFLEDVRETVCESIKIQMVSDVPIGSFLSGGIDSSIVSAVMAKYSEEPINTFSVRMLDQKKDESAYAKLVADHIKSVHHEFTFQPGSLSSALQMLGQFDEPFADSSALPTCLVSAGASKRVKVVLSGDGADETFGGYPVYRNFARLGKFDKWLGRYIVNQPFFGALKRLISSGTKPPSAFKSLLRLLFGRPAERILLDTPGAFDANTICAMIGDGEGQDKQLTKANLIAKIESLCQQHPTLNMAALGMLVHQQTYLPDDVLTKVDISSMSFGLECRSPFLDHHVVELANRIPTGLKVNRTSLKYILREAFRDLLPPTIFKRNKQGFAIPLASLLRTSWKMEAEEILYDKSGFCQSIFAPQVVDKILRFHFSGQADNREAIWTLLCLEKWHATFMKPASTEALVAS